MKRHMTQIAATLILATVFSALPARLVSQTTKPTAVNLSKAVYQTSLPAPTNSYPFRYWDKGFLITYSIDDASPQRPSAILYDREGKIAREVIVSIEKAVSVSLSDVAVSGRGDIVVAGGTESQAGVIANFVASIGSDGRVKRLVRTTPFTPAYVCAAEDGTVWVYGSDRDENGRGIDSSLRLRQYSFDKGQIRSMLDATTLSVHGWKLSHGQYPGEISLRCNSKKVGLLNGGSSEWVEFDLSTNKLTVSKVEPLPSIKEMRITGVALTGAGDVFVSLHDRLSKPPHSGLFRLTFDNTGVGHWTAVENTLGPYLHGAAVGQLLGADDNELVYTRDFDGTAYWSKYTK